MRAIRQLGRLRAQSYSRAFCPYLRIVSEIAMFRQLTLYHHTSIMPSRVPGICYEHLP